MAEIDVGNAGSSELVLCHPRTAALRAKRDALLQSALREKTSPYPIAAEYPLVLGGSGADFSYCLMQGPDVVAHANLWPRSLVLQGHQKHRHTRREMGSKSEQQVVSVGLVGNVATAATHRGQGLMRQLLAGIKAEAGQRDLQALILWSDLGGFYQKMGFTSCGEELRWLVQPTRVNQEAAAKYGRLGKVREADARAMLACRYQVQGTLRRSVEEMMTLLSIPGMLVMAAREGGHGAMRGFVIMGKGADMGGVVHEWGAQTPQDLLGGVRAVGIEAGVDEVMILTPTGLGEAWEEELGKVAMGKEAHAMGWIWCHGEESTIKPQIEQGFIWGLDSI